MDYLLSDADRGTSFIMITGLPPRYFYEEYIIGVGEFGVALIFCY